MRCREWRAYNQPLATIQAPKLRIATAREAAMNRRRDRPDSASPSQPDTRPDLGPKVNQLHRIAKDYVLFWDIYRVFG